MKKLLILPLLLFLFVSCDAPSSTSKDSFSKDTVSYEMVDFSSYSSYFQRKESGADTTFFKAHYPDFNSEIVNTLIHTILLPEGESSLDESANNFLTGYDNYVEESIHPEHIHSWFKQIEVLVQLNTPNILFINSKNYEYSGGAHGNHFQLFYNFDLSNNSKIVLKDVINENKTKEFLNIAERYFREHENLSDTASLKEDYFFEDGIFVLADNFGFSKDGFIFHYNPYEIKSYAGGTTTYNIPYKEVENLLTDKGKQYIKGIVTYFQSI